MSQFPLKFSTLFNTPIKAGLIFLLWAQGAVPGYIVLSYFWYDLPLHLLVHQVFTNDLMTILYIQCATSIFVSLLGYVIGVLVSDLKAKNSYLEEINASREQFIATASHDLRSPIGSILGSVEILRENPKLGGAEEQESLEHIRASSNLLLELSNDILDLLETEISRTPMKIESLEIDDLLKECVQGIKYNAAKKLLNITYDKPANEPVCIQGNAVALTRIFNNILTNAVKFTPKEGSIFVSARNSGHKYVEIKFSDNGIGISEKMLPLLFEKFSQASRPGTNGEKSTGLGLSIVKALVEKQNGTIAVKSQEGKGTSFILKFPVSRAMPLIYSNNAVDLKNKRILLADDDPVNATVLKKILVSDGIITDTAENGEVAVHKFKECKFDAIVMDRNMPVMGGIQATKKIREIESNRNEKGLPIIGLTGKVSVNDHQECLDAGMNLCLHKPITKQGIINALKSCF